MNAEEFLEKCNQIHEDIIETYGQCTNCPITDFCGGGFADKDDIKGFLEVVTNYDHNNSEG